VPDFVYGNTRLRARRTGFLRRRDYESMVGLGVDELLGALSATPYAPDIERALPARHGLHRLHQAVRAHLARVLDEMRSFYRGGARTVVDLLLARWDLRNLLTLIRGQASCASVDDVLAAIVPLGGIDDALAREVARQRSFSAAIALLGALRVPTPQEASSLLDAWPEYERTHDLQALEAELTARHVERVTARLASTGAAGEPVRAALAHQIDAHNLLAALRLREVLVGGERDELSAEDRRRALMPGGALAPATLLAATEPGAPDNALLALARDPAGQRWLEPVRRWVDNVDLIALQDAFERTLTADALARFTRDDPLGAGIPVAFAAAKELEARNLRVLGDAGAHQSDPAVARARLVLV